MPSAVSIGIPTYNQSGFISRAVESCLAQTYPLIKIVIGDDHSVDTTKEVLTKYAADDRVIYYYNVSNLGRVGNYRKLLYEHSPGSDWYINLDGDDFLTDNEFISYSMCLIQKQPASSVVFFQGNHKLETIKAVFPDAKPLDEQSFLINGKDYFLQFHRIRKFTHFATIYESARARMIGFYNYDCLSADFHSLSRLSLHGNVILSARMVGTWMEHETNESKGLDNETLKNELDSLNDIARYAGRYFSETIIRTWLKKMRHYYYQRLFYQISKGNVSFDNIVFTLRHFQFNYPYFTCLGRMLLKICRIPVH